MTELHRSGEYGDRGDYHRQLDPNWSYAPIYRRKIKLVDKFVQDLPAGAKLLDVGAGEGVLVDRYKSQGRQIIGVDANYQSSNVQLASLFSLPFKDEDFDAVFCLDVLEHIHLLDQRRALREIKRVIRRNGKLFMSVPNLAHFHSRVKFLLKGRLTRTSALEKHPGDRPIGEYVEMLGQEGLRVVGRKGIFPTVPILFGLVNRHPAKLSWLVDGLDRILPLPGLCFLNVIEAEIDKSKPIGTTE
jgi:ubiquinone/menaquinone biosynthesis C-methylase UbiE